MCATSCIHQVIEGEVLSVVDRVKEFVQELPDLVRDGFDAFSRLMGRIWKGFGSQQFLAWLSLFTAVASAIATYYGYRASDRSAAVADRAQAFVERTNREQIALGRPVLSVMTGGLFSSAGETERDPTTYRLELVIHNAGARSALPAWIGLFKRDDFFGNLQGQPWTSRLISDPQVAEIPSSTDRKVVFDLGRDFSQPTEWIVGLAYGDQVPGASVAEQSTSEPTMRTLCSDVKVVLIRAPQIPKGAGAPNEIEVTSATPVFTDSSRMGSGPRNGFEVAATELAGVMYKDGRCALGAK
jgi:hypothetical protein